MAQALFHEMRTQARRQRGSGFRAQQAGLQQRADPGGGGKFRLRLVAASTPPGRCSISASAASSRPSFADIFYNNCFKNGILPIVLPQEDVDKLMDDAERGANAIVTVDLEKQEIKGPDGGCINFDDRSLPQAVPAQWLGRYRPDACSNEAKISAFEADRKASTPWL